MTREEINKIFDFLEREMNKYGLFYFKYDGSNINGCYKSTNRVFAQFYPKKILEVINKEDDTN